MPRRVLATMLVFLLAGIPLLGQTTSLGVVTQSSGGHLNSTVATVGATIFNGDLLNTEAPGTWECVPAPCSSPYPTTAPF